MKVMIQSLMVCLLIGMATFAIADTGNPKNVIIMIGDGMGFHHQEAASMYRYGKTRGQVQWNFTQFASTTYSTSASNPYNPAAAYEDFDYFKKDATDSAAAATALSTGQKTKNGMLGISPDGKILRNIMEDAEALGKSTGVLSTVFFAHATPAGFIAHVTSRSLYEKIANQMIWESAADVIIGPGHPWYDNDGKQVGGFEPNPFKTTQKYDGVGGLDSWKKLLKGEPGADADGDGQPDAWTLVDSREEIRSLASGDTPKRVLGVVPVNTTLQQERSGNEFAGPYEVNQLVTSPPMSELMGAALNVLSKNEKGFVLMAEGGAIDWASHGNQSGRVIEETIDFDRAIEYTVEWIEENSNWNETLLIITADHETGYITGPGSDPAYRPLINNGIGATPGFEWHSGDHTNQVVPVFAKGAGTDAILAKAKKEDRLRGPFIDNTDIPNTVRELLTQKVVVKPEFLVKPYLQLATQDSIRILWETTTPTNATVLYSEAQYDVKSPDLSSKQVQTGFQAMHEIELTGLKPETDYFYQVVSKTEAGETIESEIYNFKTAVNADSAFAFTVFSDTQTNPPVWSTIAEKAWGERPNFAIHSGDIVGTGSNKDQWVNHFLKPGHVFMSRIPVYAIMGNHDQDHAYYYQYIANPAPEYYYTFTYGNAQFFLVDSNRPLEAGGEIYKWLESELQKSKATWKFVVHHHSTYSSDENDYGNAYVSRSRQGDPEVQPLIPLLEQYGVDIVFVGHIHDYERTWPIYKNKVDPENGVIYLQTGGCGGGLENYAPSRSWFTAKLHRDHNFGLATVHGNTLVYQGIDIEGNVFDHFTLTK
ncbi:MAG: alkaline phosphatase [bacterium]|jgi:alkaline phosphatase|nr:alkaline phosphatase [bacterium]